MSSPQVVVDIDRDKASALGITAQQIEDSLFNAFGSRQVSTIYTSTNQYYVILELLPRISGIPGVSRRCTSARPPPANSSRSNRSRDCGRKPDP